MLAGEGRVATTFIKPFYKEQQKLLIVQSFTYLAQIFPALPGNQCQGTVSAISSWLEFAENTVGNWLKGYGGPEYSFLQNLFLDLQS